jgi:hypothetical protein
MKRLVVTVVLLGVLAVMSLVAGCGGGRALPGDASPSAVKPPSMLANAAVAYGRDTQIYLSNFAGSVAVPLTTPPAGMADGTPTWSPDGTRVAFLRRIADGSPFSDMYVASANGAGSPTLLLSGRAYSGPVPWDGGFSGGWTIDWSAEGNKIVFALSPDCAMFAAPLPQSANDVGVLDISDPAHPVFSRMGLMELGLQSVPGFASVFDVCLSPDTNPGDGKYQGIVAFKAQRFVVDGSGQQQVVDWGDIHMVKVETDPTDTTRLRPVSGVTPVYLPRDGVQSAPAFSTVASSLRLAFRSETDADDYTLMVVAVDRVGPAFVGQPGFWLPSGNALRRGATGAAWSPPTSRGGQTVEWLAFAQRLNNAKGHSLQWDVFRACQGDASAVNVTNTTGAGEAKPDWNPAWDPSRP